MVVSNVDEKRRDSLLGKAVQTMNAHNLIGISLCKTRNGNNQETDEYQGRQTKLSKCCKVSICNDPFLREGEIDNLQIVGAKTTGDLECPEVDDSTTEKETTTVLEEECRRHQLLCAAAAKEITGKANTSRNPDGSISFIQLEGKHIA